MADIEELQRRITAAIERIGKGVERLDAAAEDSENEKVDVDALKAKLATTEATLEDERLAGQQREERIKALHAKLEDVEDTMKSRLEAQSEETAQIDLELQRLRKANTQLRDNNRALRDANGAGLADAQLINAGLTAELDALNAMRAAETAEAEAIAAALKQLLPSDANRENV